MAAIPRDRAPDGSLAFLREGYDFIRNRCRRLGSDVFETRLLLHRATCMMGAEAAEIFYGGDRFTRVGSMPITVLKLLQDFASVQLLDGVAHRHRKTMFLFLARPESVAALVKQVEMEWKSKIPAWSEREQIVLFDELRKILCRAVCAWVGIPLSEKEVGRRTRELSEMVEATGSIGPRNWRAQWLRSRCERWVRRRVLALRQGKLNRPDDSPIAVVARHRDLQGELLPPKVAAVEIINLLRATVAVARYQVFVAMALHQYPECRRRIAAGDAGYIEGFVQEVRRFYPFFPCIGGRVQRSFEWRGKRFAEGDWVILDLYGTNHDPRSHRDPETFDPERREAPAPENFAFIPQGGGDPRQGHRCPGEGITVELMRLAAILLTGAMHYEVPEQDLGIDLTRIPALPKSGFVISRVEAVGASTGTGLGGAQVAFQA